MVTVPSRRQSFTAAAITTSMTRPLAPPIPPPRHTQFYPENPRQLQEHCDIHFSKPRLKPHMSWKKFTQRTKYRGRTTRNTSTRMTVAQKLAWWPQHSAIREYFDLAYKGEAISVERFTWSVFPFLSRADRKAWEGALGIPGLAIFVDTPLCPPLCPLRRRFRGCGRDIASISTQHTDTSPFALVHWSWPFLSVYDREALHHAYSVPAQPRMPTGFTTNSPTSVILAYAQLRAHACHCSVGYLRRPRHPVTPLPCEIPYKRVRDNGIALLRYDFVYADFIRSMARTYTYQGRNIDAIWDIIDSVSHIPHAPGWPEVDFERAFRAMTLGVPLAGDFACTYTSVTARNLYDNHPTVRTPEVRQAIKTKFVKEEDLSYNVVFQCWLWRFIPGLFLNPLTFVMPKYLGDMGRICVDATNTITRNDDGAPNGQIPRPGTPSRLDENPPIAYGSAFTRCLTWIYNVRVDHPTDDILMMPDDISSAFHQLFYHPRMMPVFASVFSTYLCIPAGTIFGGCSSPSFYMLLGEL